MFDEYYSVSLSFWTRSGPEGEGPPRPPRRQPALGLRPRPRTPSSPFLDPSARRSSPRCSTRYATGQESDRTIAAWLNAKGARTARGRPFGKDTVREMLCNAAYAGYVTGLRDKSRAIKGLHEPIVSEELFDRVQEVRSWRTRVAEARPPIRGVPAAQAALLRALRRAHARHPRLAAASPPLHVLHPPPRRRLRRADRQGRSRWRSSSSTGCAASSPTARLLRRCCSTRSEPHASQQPGRAPSAAASCSPSSSACATSTSSATSPRRSTSCAAKPSRRSSSASARQPTPTSTAPRRCSRTSRASGSSRPTPPSDAGCCSRCSRRSGRRTDTIVAVQPHDAFLPYFQAAISSRNKAGREEVVPKAGATGLEPATSAVTGQRSNLLSYAPAMASRYATGRRSALAQYAKARRTSACRGETGQPASRCD